VFSSNSSLLADEGENIGNDRALERNRQTNGKKILLQVLAAMVGTFILGARVWIIIMMSDVIVSVGLLMLVFFGIDLDPHFPPNSNVRRTDIPP
jgi:hypothetical protein